MAGTFTNIVYHIVFSTKNRQPFLTPEISTRVYSYLAGAIRGEKGVLYEIGGMADHVHLLIRWRPDETISNLVGMIKRNTTIWIHDTFPELSDFYWQEGYGAFTVSSSQVDKAKVYIQNQEEHHRTTDFKMEFVALLKAHHVEYDPETIWK
jgi:REP element-mobilizing transposase RayT